MTEPIRSRTDLVRAAREGDLDAFAAIVAEERRTLIMAARAFIGDFHEAEDAAHEALVAAWRHLADLRDPGSFGPWLSRILTRIALRRRSALGRRRSVGDPGAIPASDDAPDSRLDRLLREVTELPEKYRVLITMHYLRGHDYREVGEATGLPVKRVKSRLFEARKMLRKRMSDA